MSTKTFLTGVTGFIVGGLAGALVALFNAPQSGEETRAKLRDKSLEIKDKTRDRIQNTRDQAMQLANDLRDNVQTRTSKLIQVGREVVDKEKQLLDQSAKDAQKALNPSHAKSS